MEGDLPLAEGGGDRFEVGTFACQDREVTVDQRAGVVIGPDAVGNGNGLAVEVWRNYNLHRASIALYGHKRLFPHDWVGQP